jgi:hypothetical protein
LLIRGAPFEKSFLKNAKALFSPCKGDLHKRKPTLKFFACQGEATMPASAGKLIAQSWKFRAGSSKVEGGKLF